LVVPNGQKRTQKIPVAINMFRSNNQEKNNFILVKVYQRNRLVFENWASHQLLQTQFIIITDIRPMGI